MSKLLDGDDEASSATINGQTCPLLCDDCRNEQPEKQWLLQHYHSENHQKHVIRRLQGEMGDNGENGFTQTDGNVSEDDARLGQFYERISLTTNDLETSAERCHGLEGEISESKSQMLSFSEQLDEAKEEYSIEVEQTKAVALNQQILQHDFTSLLEKIDNDKQIIREQPDGSMIFRIPRVQEKMYDAQSERQTSIYSPSFYTSTYGYRVCVRLYLNGDGTARGTHASIFLVILRGKYDAILKWPFHFRVSFCLCDQRTMIENNGTVQPKHIISSFRPDPHSRSFERPRSNMNIASGIPKFCPLEDLDCSNNSNVYIVNDTMYIRTLIDFLDLPRSILPFIFNMNVGLPVSVQQKLISDELKRQQEQTSN